MQVTLKLSSHNLIVCARKNLWLFCNGTIQKMPSRVVRILMLSCAILCGCSTLEFQPGKNPKDASDPLQGNHSPLLPGKHLVRVSPYVFLSDFEIQKDLPLFQELSQLRDQIYGDLKLPDSTTMIQVYLFEDREKYDKFMQAKYPKLPSRRAFFVAQTRGVGRSEDLLIYTYWGDRVQQDLRHELTHALLHSVLKDVPLWLDEGLAEYYEIPPENKGVNPQHVEQLRKDIQNEFNPDLIRLEMLDEVGKMNRAEYREAWAWVHYLLHSTPENKKVILTFIQLLRENPNPGSLREKLVENVQMPESELKAHILRMDIPSTAKATTKP